MNSSVALVAAVAASLKVSLVALPDAAGPMTGTGFSPTEGHRAFLQVTIQNRHRWPVVLYDLEVRAEGYFSPPGRLFSREEFNTEWLSADSWTGSAERVVATFRWYRGRPGPVEGPRASSDLLGGASNPGYRWIRPDGVLAPQQALVRSYPWVPVQPGGQLTFACSARVRSIDWRPGLTSGVMVLSPETPIPDPPAWTARRSDPPEGYESPEVRLSFECPRAGHAHSARTVAVVPGPLPQGMGVAGDARETVVEAWIVARPASPALKSLLVQWAVPVRAAAFAPRTGTWFLSGGRRTLVVEDRRRLELRQEVADFMLRRVHDGRDAGDWTIRAQFSVPEIMRGPLAPFRGPGDEYRIPPAALVDRMLDADRLGVWVTDDGFMEPPRE